MTERPNGDRNIIWKGTYAEETVLPTVVELVPETTVELLVVAGVLVVEPEAATVEEEAPVAEDPLAAPVAEGLSIQSKINGKKI